MKLSIPAFIIFSSFTFIQAGIAIQDTDNDGIADNIDKCQIPVYANQALIQFLRINIY